MRYFIAIFILFLGLNIHAQENPAIYTISVLVKGPEGKAIPNATVIVNDTAIGITNIQGNYIFKAKPARVKTIGVRHTGFQPYKAPLSFPEKGLRIDLDINMKFNELGTVEIVEKSRTDNLQRLSSNQIDRIPSASGDFIQKTLGAQAGVAINNELSASYAVRGGSYDENLIYVNGIEVYRPFLVRAGQQEGLSFINPAMVNTVQFSAGGFAARYGDKMSSVLDITYKKPKKLQGEAALGLMGGNLALGNASKNGKWTYISGVRYRTNQLLLGSLETKGEYQPQFWDAQAYVTHKLSDKTDIGFLGVYSSNRFRFVPTTRTTEFGGFSQALRFTVFFDGKEESLQRAATAAVDVTHRFSDKFKLQVIGSHFYTYQQENFDIVGQYRLDETNRDFGSDDFGEVARNLGVGGFLNHARNHITGNISSLQARLFYQAGQHYVRGGITASVEQFDEQWKEYQYVDSADYSLPQDPNAVQVFESIRAKNVLTTQRIQFYAEDEISFNYPNGSELALNIGARGHYYAYNQQLVGGPRVSLAYYPKMSRQLNDSTLIKRDVTFRLAGGLYFQPPFYRELRGFDGTINNSIQAQQSAHIVGSMEYGLFMWNRPFKLITEAYYKDYKNLIPYELENVRIRYYGNNDSKGYATGFDFKLHGEFIEGLESWVSAGILFTEEDLANDREVYYLNQSGDTIRSFTFDKTVADSIVNAPGFIPRPSDQRFRFGLYFKDEMPGFEDLTVQLSFQFGTGLPFGPPDFNRYKDILRTTSYKRVDVGFSKEFIKENGKTPAFLSNVKSLTLSVEILNLLDAQNVVNSTWIRDVSGGYYGVPNYLTRRLVNVKLSAIF